MATTQPSVLAQPRTPELIHPVARRLVWILFVLALANGAFLYLLPSLAKTHYAWAIQPPINAAFMGAGYAAGMIATGLALFGARYWRSIRTLFPGFFVLGSALLLATLLHAGRFKWDYALTWVWTLVYLSIPFGSALVWRWHERQASLPAPGLRLNRIRTPSLWLGLALTLFAAVLYALPQLFLQAWPWTITPLLARVFAGWYFLAGLFLLTTGLSLRQAREIPVAYATLVAWNVLSLLLVLIYPESVRIGGGLWVWTVSHGVVLVFCAWATLVALQMMRREQQPL
jgi:hypothetical protein